MGRPVLRRHIWGYSVCPCPIKKDAMLILNTQCVCFTVYVLFLPCYLFVCFLWFLPRSICSRLHDLYYCRFRLPQSQSLKWLTAQLGRNSTGTRSMIAVCYGYRIKLYRINIIRDMVMQLNFTYLPKTGHHSKHMVASQTSWL